MSNKPEVCHFCQGTNDLQRIRVEVLAGTWKKVRICKRCRCKTCSGRGAIEADHWDLNDPNNHLGWVPCPDCVEPEEPKTEGQLIVEGMVDRIGTWWL